MLGYDYTLDPASNITQIDDLRPAAIPVGDARRNTQIFGYDDLYRLRSVQFSFNLQGGAIRDDGQINFTYDRLGNMLSKVATQSHVDDGLEVANLGVLTYAGGTSGRGVRMPGDPPGPHALTATASGETLAYDDNGNVERLGGKSLTWDFKDRLVAVEDASIRATYSYDFDNRRVIKFVEYKAAASGVPASPSETTLYPDRHYEARPRHTPVKYVYNGMTRVARVTDTLNIAAGGMPATPEGIRYYHQDHLGSSNLLADGNGNLVEEMAFYPFGHPRNTYVPGGTGGEPYLFTQKEKDKESGLQYFEVRYLAGPLGRFLSVDLAGPKPEQPQTLNPYSYVSNQPLRLVDPSGFQGQDIDNLFRTRRRLTRSITRLNAKEQSIMRDLRGLVREQEAISAKMMGKVSALAESQTDAPLGVLALGAAVVNPIAGLGVGTVGAGVDLVAGPEGPGTVDAVVIGGEVLAETTLKHGAAAVSGTALAGAKTVYKLEKAYTASQYGHLLEASERISRKIRSGIHQVGAVREFRQDFQERLDQVDQEILSHPSQQ